MDKWVSSTRRSGRTLQHLRQLRTLRTARIVHISCTLLCTVGGEFTEPIDDLAITATLLNEAVQPITTITPALITGHAKHIEFADEIAEDGCAVAGHFYRMLMVGTILFDAYWFVIMGPKSEYLANAKECEGRAQEMPPALRHTFITLAAHWRKLASNAAEVANRQESQEAADREKRRNGLQRTKR